MSRRLGLRAMVAGLRGDGHQPQVGDTWTVRLAEDELEAEVTVTIRHRVGPDLVRQIRAGVLQHLSQFSHRVAHCGARVHIGRKGWSRRERECSNRVTAAVVSKGSLTGRSYYVYVCSHHTESGHGIDPAEVLAVVPLHEHELAPIRAQHQAAFAAAVARWDAKAAQTRNTSEEE